MATMYQSEGTLSQVRSSVTKNDESSNCCILDFVPESESLTNVEEEAPVTSPIPFQVEVHEQPPSQNRGKNRMVPRHSVQKCKNGITASVKSYVTKSGRKVKPKMPWNL
jgi:hypothetical protein